MEDLINYVSVTLSRPWIRIEDCWEYYLVVLIWSHQYEGHTARPNNIVGIHCLNQFLPATSVVKVIESALSVYLWVCTLTTELHKMTSIQLSSWLVIAHLKKHTKMACKYKAAAWLC